MSERGRQTRERLIDAATRLFGERGFAGVSTRDIASASGTNLPSIAHHFGSKQGLYSAVIQSIADELRERLTPSLAEAARVLEQSPASRDHALEALQGLVAAHATALLLNRPDWLALVVQEQLHPTEERNPLTDFVEKRFMKTVCQLIGALRGLPVSAEAVKLQAFMLVGRVIAFRVAQRGALQALGWKRFTPAAVEVVVAALREETEVVFRAR